MRTFILAENAKLYLTGMKCVEILLQWSLFRLMKAMKKNRRVIILRIQDDSNYLEISIRLKLGMMVRQTSRLCLSH